MKKLFCNKCKKFKENFIYANPYNSTKFCFNCFTAMEMCEYQEICKNEENTDFIEQAIKNAIFKMFDE